jgi:hypothetical protein
MADIAGVRWSGHEDSHPVVHLPERDYADEAARRDWQKQGYSTTPLFGSHPVLQRCPACSGAPPAETEPDHLDVLAGELLALSAPSAAYGSDRARWERNAKGVAARIFRYGMAVGRDKAVAAAAPQAPRLACGA